MQKNPDSFVYKNQKKLRRGYTTGSCAAGAAKAAAVLLFSGENAEYVSVRTPSGIVLHLRTENPGRTEKEAWCGIRKDAGDDIDATDGILIMARARRIPEPASGKGPDIVIRGGSGVGTVTKIGLDQPVGESAINSVPRRMIREEVGEVLREYHYTGSLAIEISVPDGEKIAEQTFNPRLGIVGGISILGTTGIVEPMSEQALVETIRVEMKQRRQMGEKNLLLAPGNFGLDFIHRQYGISPERAVVCSNFIGDTLDMALHMNFQSVLLVGHIGKLCKLGAGIMNTHSHIADGRMETLCACGIEAGLPTVQLQKLLKCCTTEEALSYLMKNQIWEPVRNVLLERIERQMTMRVHGKMQMAAVLFSSGYGYLGRTAKAEKLIEKIAADNIAEGF